MKHLFKRLTAWLLACVMLVTLLPAQAFAAERRTAATFEDVTADSWFYQPVLDAVEAGIFSGVSSTRFDPLGRMSRAMFVTVLGQLDGVSPADYPGDGGFPDVKAGEWYAPYVVWASRGGIVQGYGDGRFAPDDPITREQMASMLVRWMDAAGIPLDRQSGSRQPVDLSTVSDWAQEAVLALWNAGLMQGDSAGNVNPGAYATRAEGASFFLRARETTTAWRSQSTEQSTETTQLEQKPEKGPEKDSDKTPVSSNRRPNSGGSGGSGSGGQTNDCVITFNTNGGNVLESRTVRRGSVLGILPTPFKPGYLFQGWYYDSELTELASADDAVNGPIVLYAQYEAAAGATESSTPYYTAQTGVGPGFEIQVVCADTGLTVDDVRAMITAKDLNDEDADFRIEGSNGAFTISGGGDGFTPGASYRIILEDEHLTFSGEEDTIREYHFTVDRSDRVQELTLQDEIKYIPKEALDGDVNAALVRLGAAELLDEKTDTGTFTYTGKDPALAVGDTVSIYEGIHPLKRNEQTHEQKGNTGEVSYVKITEVNGNQYTYVSAEVDDVVFTPDVLPVSKGIDKDGDPDDNSMLVDEADLDFTDSKYSDLGLDASTTIDVGDFIAFYDGTFPEGASGDIQLERYVEIIAVTLVGDQYKIDYIEADYDEVVAAMDVFTTDSISGDELLDGTDVDALERSLERQAEESGFVEEAGQYLAAAAMQTDAFRRIEQDVYGMRPGEDMQLFAANRRVKVETSHRASINTRLVHFKGLSGVRAQLTVNATVTFRLNDGSNAVINMSGTFEQEVRVSLNVSGGAVWKWKWIFPYIADYKATASADLYAYTGIGVKATITTKENGQESIGDQIKSLLQSGGDSSVAASLQERYQEMLENDNDWVDLFSVALVRQRFTVALIFTVHLDVDFVVSANLNVSLGASFWYENAKRYVYNITLFQGKVTSDTINLVTERYVIDFYVLGELGLRAGVRVDVSLSLITKNLAYVGVTAEAGVYLQLYGFFYYRYEATSKKKVSKSSGALLLELGAYLKITFNASALGGKYSYNPTLYNREWPLLRAGTSDHVLNFAALRNAPSVKMKNNDRTATLSSDIFNMELMHLQNGSTYNRNYGSNNFTYQTDNSKFTVKAAGGNRLTVTVNPGAKDFQLDGKLTITWKGQGIAFSSQPMQRVIPLHWDNLKDRYSISFDSRGGSYVGTIATPYGTSIRQPQNPSRTGYTFTGWFTDSSCRTPYRFPGTMPNQDTRVYAGWRARTDTAYQVQHYQQGLNGKYVLAETERGTGTTDATVTPAVKQYEGFYSPAAQRLTVSADGRATLRYNYPRRTYTMTFDPGQGQGQIQKRFLYGENVKNAAPRVAAAGYTFVGWEGLPDTMPAGNRTAAARWNPRNDIPYRVEYYQEKDGEAGKYELKETVTREGTTGTAAVPELQSYPGFQAGRYTETTIAGNGSTVVRVYYDRVLVQLTYNLNAADASFAEGVADKVSQPSGSEVTLLTGEQVRRLGYGFTGWYTEPECRNQFDGMMPAGDITVYAGWVSGEVSYTVKHYQQNADDDEYTLVDTEELKANVGTEVTPPVKEYPHFIAPTEQKVPVAADGSTVIEYRYNRKTYTLEWDFGDGDCNTQYTSGKVRYGKKVVKPIPVQDGYAFTGWSTLSEGFGPDGRMPGNDYYATALWEVDRPITVVLNADGNPELKTLLGGDTKTEQMSASTVLTLPETVTGQTGWRTQSGETITEPMTVGQIAFGLDKINLYPIWDN